MTDTAIDGGCQKKCWGAAAVIGLLVLIFALAGHRGIVAAILLGVLAAVLLGLLFVWLFCAPVPKPGTRPAPAPLKPAPAPAPSAPAPVTTSAPAAPAPEPEPAEKAAPAADEAPAAVKPSKPLAGEEELASRKGSWTYEGEATEAEAPAAEEDAGETRPEALTAAREGGPDNLKEIKGVGPKLESLLHELGIFHFDQIAGWSAAEVAWMDSNLKGFRGRVSRDDWIGQARILAAGGDTEFSQRVDKGEVY
ncbi:endonuclease [Salipiger abyssi]|uniref:endonuclease n=1 Tax=Salipiger abyssi TaxID=1250539 RepID=UPI0040585715